MYADMMYSGFRGLFGGPPQPTSAYHQAQYFGGMGNGSEKLPCALAFTPCKIRFHVKHVFVTPKIIHLQIQLSSIKKWPFVILNKVRIDLDGNKMLKSLE
jgi:hypothetical protein